MVQYIAMFVYFCPQHALAKKAITDLASLYGTRYRYGSIINTICKYNHKHIVWDGIVEHYGKHS